ncbi:MAG TPA: signal peptidase I [Candidatus Hydrogenedentes bacterium]|nr:signal peptidase I [Candidatus Hydrogenedentota bacterium]
MAGRGKKRENIQPGGKPSRGAQAAKAGLGALLVGALAWLTGGFTRESAIEWAKTILVAGSLALAIRWSVAEPFRIPSGSMEPTLHGDPHFLLGDRVFVNKWRYGLRYPFMKKRIYYGESPKRWDIVVFKSAEQDATQTTLIKRIAGLPGERVHIQDGKLYVNGEPLPFPPDMPPDMHYADEREMGVPFMGHRERMKYGIAPEDEYSVIPEGHYFLLGDNTQKSRDGRFWGWVPNENLLGPATCIWWPPGRVRDFTGFSKTWWWRSLLAVVGLLLVFRLFWVRSWHVRADAAQSAVRRGDHLCVDRCVFGLPVPFTRRRLTAGRPPRRGELVLYRAGSDPREKMQLGWVAGLPGERVLIEGGELTINDAPLTGSAALAGMRFDAPAITGSYGRSRSKTYSVVPENSYFLLSEAPEEPVDSRSLGWVPREQLVGKATAVWWPPTHWRRLRPEPEQTRTGE